MHDELIVHIGNWKRNIALPRILAGLPVSGARYEEQQLVVSFKALVNGALPVGSDDDHS